MRIAALAPPFQPDPKHPTVVGVRKGSAVDDFAAAVAKAAGTSVPVLEGLANDAPRDGYLLLFDPIGLSESMAITSRSILIDANRSYVMGDLEQYQLLGAIESFRYFQWRSRQHEETGYGLIGRKEVAASMGAQLVEGPYTTEHYALISTERAHDLPSLVVAYLSAVNELHSPQHRA